MGKSSKNNSLASPEEASPEEASGAVVSPDEASGAVASPDVVSGAVASPDVVSGAVSPDVLSREELLVLYNKTVERLIQTTNAFGRSLQQIAYLEHQLQKTTEKRNGLLAIISRHFGDP